MFRGVIFDFNGTPLLWDTHLHNQAWDIFLMKHNISLTDQQKDEIMQGRNSDLIISALFKRDLAEDELNQFIYAIATASGKENIDFYLEHFRLGSMLDKEHIIFN